jgi:hypothetical protein
MQHRGKRTPVSRQDCLKQKQRMTKEAGEAIATGLSERFDLEGTYCLVPRHDDPSRFFISPAVDRRGYRACVGRDQIAAALLC